MKIALAGNPNVGKSTVFNSLTGLKQHTGNWTGKTVENARGFCKFEGHQFEVIDLPGTYSIISNSKDEEVARDFICFSDVDVVVVVADATVLERNLNLVLQILEIHKKVVLCVNLLDEARRKNIQIDLDKLSSILGIPVVGIVATKKNNAKKVLQAVLRCKETTYEIKYLPLIDEQIRVLASEIKENFSSIFMAINLIANDEILLDNISKKVGVDVVEKYKENTQEAIYNLERLEVTREEFVEQIVMSNILECEKIASKVVSKNSISNHNVKIDKVLTSKTFGIPIMLSILAVVFFISIYLANYPSQWLAMLFNQVEQYLAKFCDALHLPKFIKGALVDGVFKSTGWVIAVMLPPMAIFFPLFTFLEDLGYLPRVAFNLDKPFKCCGCSGKQSYTMCMGFGCNSVGVMGTRIIDNKKERLIAILTNSFVPCNGRFPTLIAISSIFIGGLFANQFLSSIVSTLTVTSIVLLGVLLTFSVSKLLSVTILKSQKNVFSLELPPYRRPQIKKILIRSLLDRTIFVLARAVIVAMPSGLVIWILANTKITDTTALAYICNFFEPLGTFMGLDGVILTAFILGFAANEIVLPIAILCYSQATMLTDIPTLSNLGDFLLQNGWTMTTAICMLLFCLVHFPCATTILTIKKETKSLKWTALSIILPSIIGVILCSLVAVII